MEDSVINFELTAAVEYKGCLYFSGIKINGLYRMNMETGETEYLASFEKEEERHILHRHAYRYGIVKHGLFHGWESILYV